MFNENPAQEKVGGFLQAFNSFKDRLYVFDINRLLH